MGIFFHGATLAFDLSCIGIWVCDLEYDGIGAKGKRFFSALGESFYEHESAERLRSARPIDTLQFGAKTGPDFGKYFGGDAREFAQVAGVGWLAGRACIVGDVK